MFYIVEVKKSADGSCEHFVQTAETRAEAESNYHGVLQAAAVSSYPLHGAIIFSDMCFPVLYQCYEHETDAESGAGDYNRELEDKAEAFDILTGGITE